MEYVDPIKAVNDIEAMKRVLRQHSQRDLLLFVFGINTGLRVSNLLAVKVGQLRNEHGIREFLEVQDAHNGEPKSFYINASVKTELTAYLSHVRLEDGDYLFQSKNKSAPISRQQAYRIIHQAAQEAGVPGQIGTHTLRKTFGYHAYRKGIAISILMKIFNHQSPAETLRYIGVEKHENHRIRVDVNL